MSVKYDFSCNLLKITSFTVLFAFTVLFLFEARKSEAADNNPAQKKTNSRYQKTSSVKLKAFQAESFADGVKLSWQTDYEKNVIGYRVWRSYGGKKELVNTDLIGGSLSKNAKGILEIGSEYMISDLKGNEQSLYILEAVEADGRINYLGNFGVQTGNDFHKSLVPETPIEPSGAIGQLDRIDFDQNGVNSIEMTVLENNSNFTNDSTAVKFEVKKDGLYRIEAAELEQLGIFNSGEWKLFTGGIEQSVKINQDGSVEFYGRGIDTIYSDARIYWLTRNFGIGKRINAVPQNFDETAQTGWSRIVAGKKDRLIRASGILNGERENWYAGYVYSVALNQTLTLNEIATESGVNAVLSVDLQGAGSAQHQVAVVLNGIQVGQIDFNYTERKEWSVNLPLSHLVEGENSISLRSLAASDVSFLESVRISYPRRHKAVNNRIDFQTAPGQKTKLTGFTDPNVRIFDVTNNDTIIEFAPESRQETDGTYTVTFDSSSDARKLFAQAENFQINRAENLSLNEASDLRNTANRAKFIIIAHSAINKYLWEIKARRDREGLPTEFVNVSDIYDEFNHGIKSAAAIKDFLRYAKQNWTVKPEYVMLAGDASVDPRNYSGLGGNAKDIIPTMFVDTWNIEAVTDEMLVDFDGDNIGEMAIGRLPYRTREDLEAMTNKIYSIEPMSLPQINQRGVVFVSDSLQGYDFAAASRNIAAPIPGAIAPIYIDRGAQDSTVVKNDILARINGGAIVVNYFGHGQIHNWTSGNILRNTDAPSMLNIKRPSLMAMIACLNGAFAETNIESLAEAVMKTPSGGAFAVWSASASNTAVEQELLAKEYHQRIFSGMRLGDAARETKMTTNVPDIRLTYVFFGDPTQRIVIE